MSAPESPDLGERPLPARRRRTTSPRVLWIDRVSTAVISVGGIAVILGVLGIFVYLIAVAAPLFRGATLTAEGSFPLLRAEEIPHLLFAEIDEYAAFGQYALSTGELVSFAARNGDIVARSRLYPEGLTLTSWSRPPGSADLALGFADGSIRLARLGFDTRFLTPDEKVELGPSGYGVVDGGVVERTAKGENRRVELEFEDRGSLAVGEPGNALLLVDYRPAEPITRLAAFRADGSLVIAEIEQRKNLITGETSNELTLTPLPLPAEMGAIAPRFLLLAANGQQLVLAWKDGTALRYDLRDLQSPVLAESTRLAAGNGVELTALRFMLGEQSLLAADSAGDVRAWFRIPLAGKPWAGAMTADGNRLVTAHALKGRGSPVTTLATSLRDKSFVATDAQGGVLLYHLTSEQRLAETRVESKAAAIASQIAPKSDAIFVVGEDGRANLWRLKNPHPETTFRSLFGRVWYEGAPAPSYTWQSSSGTDDFEPKLSLVPLIFGTLKATFYSMLFAVPIALLAALYTSEFLDRRLRVPLKSLVEVMASLPSVVLGFLAALVLAPVVERSLVAVLLGLALIPVSAQLLGHVWQALPRHFTLPLSGRFPFLLLIAVLVAAGIAASVAGASLERLLFQGDVRAWLDGRAGTATPGWALLMWPLSWVGLMLADRAWFVPLLARRSAVRPIASVARRELVKSLLVLAASMVLAWLTGSLLTGIGFDPRGSLVGTYVQRNALIVGFVMGFAVIPIIYTIAEDSLAAVPKTLRSASLGCGATPWQTATRVVIPVAMSGIFSALMIGLGRAVGETMIVLMAAGNTPVLDLNPFNGLRTLAANIAVELPEAVKEGTLYRVLFLSALTLLVFTSIVNTIAEIVRQRFRRRAFEL